MKPSYPPQPSDVTAWSCFEQSGKIQDYLNYCAKTRAGAESVREGIENDAGDSQRIGHQGESSQQR